MTTTFIEEDRPKLDPFKPTPPMTYGERNCFTFFTFKVNGSGRVIQLEGNKYERTPEGSFSFKETKVVEPNQGERYAPDCADFFIWGGTCFMPNSSKYLDIFLREWDLDRLLLIAQDTETVRWGAYSFSKRDLSLRVRYGNSWGRIFSFEEIFPKEEILKIDTKDTQPLELEAFSKIGLDVLEAGLSYGLRLDTGQSAASIAQLFLLDHLKSCFPSNQRNYLLHIERAHQCFKAARFEARLHGIFPSLYYYDLKNAYPRVLMSCSAIQDCQWIDDPHYHREAFYGFIRCRVVTAEQLLFSPLMARLLTMWGPRLIGFLGYLELWVTKDEYDFMLSDGLGRCIEIQEASWGVSQSNMRPFIKPMQTLIDLADTHLLLGNLAKAISQKIVGKMGQVWLDKDTVWDYWGGHYITIESWGAPSISGIIYAAKAVGAVKARITRLALKYNAIAILADGFYTTSPIPDYELGDNLKLKAVGVGGVWTDMYHDHPGEASKYLDILRGSTSSKSLIRVPVESIQTIKGINHDLGLSKGASQIGRRLRVVRDITLGTKKRTMGPCSKGDYLTGNPDSSAPGPSDKLDILEKQYPHEY